MPCYSIQLTTETNKIHAAVTAASELNSLEESILVKHSYFQRTQPLLFWGWGGVTVSY